MRWYILTVTQLLTLPPHHSLFLVGCKFYVVVSLTLCLSYYIVFLILHLKCKMCSSCRGHSQWWYSSWRGGVSLSCSDSGLCHPGHSWTGLRCCLHTLQLNIPREKANLSYLLIVHTYKQKSFPYLCLSSLSLTQTQTYRVFCAWTACVNVILEFSCVHTVG